MHLPRALADALARELATPIRSFQALAGGDINRAFRLETSQRSFFLKYNAYPQGADMLRTEKSGLDLLAATGSISIPEPVAQGSAQSYHFLLLEDWSGHRAGANFWKNFGHKLALLHQNTAPKFGLHEDNFIASLPQRNQQHDSWTSFYWEERLFPLLQKGLDKQLISYKEFQDVIPLGNKLEQIFPHTAPALLHGDLWSGNYMIAPDGQAGLIDPAIYYGHREMDLAMTRLFGGFPEVFYQTYQSTFPLEAGWTERIPICQLYPLLVHLLLFGRSYWGSIQQVLALYR